MRRGHLRFSGGAGICANAPRAFAKRYDVQTPVRQLTAIAISR